MDSKAYPRITIAGTSSGVGKTTLSLAIMAALTKRGLNVQGFKVGPDFIDPGYYRMVTGWPGRNLDTWMIGKSNTLACFLNSADRADISVIEGVMGLYDGKAGFAAGSTAEVSKLIKSPVVLTIDCSKMGGSAGAIALGYQKYDEDINLRGFILNNIGSDSHEAMVKRSVEDATGLTVFGCVRRDAGVRIPERHLGLVTQAETEPSEGYINALVNLAENYLDLDKLLSIARVSPELASSPECNILFTGSNGAEVPNPSEGLTIGDDKLESADGNRVKIGVAIDKAFNFYYHDNLDLLRAQGAELVFFSPLADEHIPEGVDGLYVGGGYPEVYAQQLSENTTLAAEIRGAIEDGLPVYAECGGLIYLSTAIEDFEGRTYSMSGALPITYKMQGRPTLGYREATSLSSSVIASEGDSLRGHEFHYSTIIKVGNGLKTAYKLDNGAEEGFIYKNTLASYVHVHFAGKPEIAERFVSMCKSFKGE